MPTWGNIVVYVTSFFKMHDPSITLQNTFMVFPMTLCMGATAMQLGSLMLDRLHPKVHLAIGGSVFVGSVFVAGYVEDFYLFLLFYSVLAGVGYGVIYILPLKNAWLFFPEHKGMVGGVILSSHSFAAIGWTFFTVELINPENQQPNLYVTVGNALEVLYGEDSQPPRNVQHALRVVSLVLLVLLLCALVLIQRKQAVTFDEQLRQELLQKGIVHEGGVNRQDSFLTVDSSHLDRSSSDRSFSSAGSNLSDLSHMTLRESVQDRTFWHIFVMLTLSMSFCYFIKVVFKNFGSINFNDDAYLTQVAATSFLCGASARFIWGTVQDYIGFKKVYGIIAFCLTVLAFTINEVSQNRVMYQIWIGLIFAMEGGHFSIFPALAASIYGA